jgi:hypothetical protein
MRWIVERPHGGVSTWPLSSLHLQQQLQQQASQTTLTATTSLSKPRLQQNPAAQQQQQHHTTTNSNSNNSSNNYGNKPQRQTRGGWQWVHMADRNMEQPVFSGDIGGDWAATLGRNKKGVFWCL